MLIWLQANYGYVLAAVVALDTVLAQIPSLAANSTFQLFANAVKSLLPK